MNTKSTTQILFGFLLVAIGVGFLLGGLNIIDFGSFIRQFWPLAIIVTGVVALAANPRMFLWPLVAVAVGALLLLRNFAVIDFNIWALLWPSVIIAVGLSIIFERTRKPVKAVGDQTLNTFAAFGGSTIRNSSADFKGGDSTVLFGGTDIDLREAVIKKDAQMHVFVAFGGLDIRVPEGWKVKIDGAPVLGGWEDKTRPPKGDAPLLHIRGTCILGGIEIKH